MYAHRQLGPFLTVCSTLSKALHGHQALLNPLPFFHWWHQLTTKMSISRETGVIVNWGKETLAEMSINLGYYTTFRENTVIEQ